MAQLSSTSDNVHIDKVGTGYVVTITGGAGITVLVIGDQGAMIDMSGARIDMGDLTAAKMMLPRVGGDHLVTSLHQGDNNSAVLRGIYQTWRGRRL